MCFKFLLLFVLFYLIQFAENAKIPRQKRESDLPVYDTIVVGMGASGTSAFSKLARHGKRVLALEAADRIGGRVYTSKFGENLVELGAEWIHGRNNSRTYELAMANNIPIKLQESTMKNYRSNGSEVDTQLIEDLITNCLVDPDDTVEAQPLGQFLTKQCIEYISKNKPELQKDEDFVREFLHLLNVFQSQSEGSDNWYQVTTKSKYMELDEFFTNSWHKYGYKTLFEIILNKYNNGPGLPENAVIKLNKEVAEILWTRDPNEFVVVKCKDGSEYKAKNVIVTLSLGVLKARHTTLFSPSLPEKKAKAINKISMGLLDKVLFTFKKSWWPKDISFFNFIWKGEDKAKIPAEDFWIKDMISASRSMGSENVLVLWMIGEGARKVETLPDDMVQNKTMALLRTFMGSDIPEPSAMIRTKWFSNPLTLGSYSFDNLETPQNPDVREDLAAPILDSAQNPRVLFAGEATNCDGHFSTVHGAVETGIREANRILGDDKNTIY